MTSVGILLVVKPAPHIPIGRVELRGRVSVRIAQPDGRRGCVLLNENPFYAAIIVIRSRRN